MARTRLFAVLATLAVGTAALLAAELLVRIAIGMPAAPPARDAGLPRLHEPDPVLGWRNEAGRIVWPGRGPDAGRPIVYTFEPGGRRATRSAPVPNRPTTVLLGCSYTQGWAVTDEETFAWRLQARFPALDVVNLGTAGYGTYQSLLALERFLEAGASLTTLVVYGFIDNHELRNVAPALWLRALATATAAGPLAVPFATLDMGERLRRHVPEEYPAWPFGDRLASVAFLQARHADGRSAPRARQARPVTEALLRELDATSAAHGATLLVAMLEARPAARDHWTAWLAGEGIDAVDCTDPRSTAGKYQVPGYGHPGREMNATWAECIGGAIASLRSAARIP